MTVSRAADGGALADVLLEPRHIGLHAPTPMAPQLPLQQQLPSSSLPLSSTLPFPCISLTASWESMKKGVVNEFQCFLCFR